jgi:uncharacterized protein YndB with AHSA1/START domain
MTESATAQDITITRVFDAPREALWKAWTEPDQIASWWGPHGWTNPLSKISMDVRPGGAFRIVSISDADGTEMPSQGLYRDVVEPERLVFEEPAEGSWHEGAVSVVTLTDLGDGRTEVVLQTTIHTTDEMRAQAEHGMKRSLDRLAEHLS